MWQVGSTNVRGNVRARKNGNIKSQQGWVLEEKVFLKFND